LIAHIGHANTGTGTGRSGAFPPSLPLPSPLPPATLPRMLLQEGTIRRAAHKVIASYSRTGKFNIM
jgi:hypothetical protein